MEGQADGTAAKAEKPVKAAKAKRATTTKAKRTKEKPAVRKRLIWVLYNGSMKEEGRFPYDQRAEAEEKLELLRSKSKKLYFIHPVKEIIGDPSATIGLAAAAAAAKLAATVIPDIPEEPEEEILADVEVEFPDDAGDDAEEEEDDGGDSDE